MRPIQYASSTSSHAAPQIAPQIVPQTTETHSRPSWGSRTLSNMMSTVLVAVGAFAIFWLLANVTALLMVRG